MSDMRDKDIISKGPKKRDPACLQFISAITIPPGTVLRQDPGEEDTFSCPLAGGKFVIDRAAAEARPSVFKRVIA